jgi:hypothetical protein
MAQRQGKYWKVNIVSESHKASFQSGNIKFRCPVRAIKRKQMNWAYKLKYCFPSCSKMQTESLPQMRKGHGPGKCNATPLPAWFLHFVVRKHSAPYHKLNVLLPVVTGEGLLIWKKWLNEDSLAKEKLTISWKDGFWLSLNFLAFQTSWVLKVWMFTFSCHTLFRTSTQNSRNEDFYWMSGRRYNIGVIYNPWFGRMLT